MSLKRPYSAHKMCKPLMSEGRGAEVGLPALFVSESENLYFLFHIKLKQLIDFAIA